MPTVQFSISSLYFLVQIFFRYAFTSHFKCFSEFEDDMSSEPISSLVDGLRVAEDNLERFQLDHIVQTNTDKRESDILL